MKLKSKKNTLLSTVPTEKHDFGIGDTSVIIEILRNRLYSNPIQTLTQEYLCNGRDANREAGNEKTPLLVTLPTKIDSVLKVRDHGPGLSPERVKDVFVLYGASTKRTDNTQTGGFGIGAKSAWAYTDSFTIISYHNKTAYTYVAHTGNNANGTLELISEDKTKEPNGVEIQIPVKPEDREYFKAAVFRSTFFWSLRPILKGVVNVEVPSWYKKSEAIVGGKNWGVYDLPDDWGLSQNPNSEDYYERDTLKGLFVIDGIPYMIPESVEELESFMRTNEFFQRGILAIHFKTGEIQVSASREAVVVEKENFKSLSKRLKEVCDDVVNSLKEEINKAKTPTELRDKMKDIHGIFSASVFPHLTLKKTLAGKKIEAAYKEGGRWGTKNVPFFKIEGVTEVMCRTLSCGYRSKKLKEERHQHHLDNDKIVFLENTNTLYVVRDDETPLDTALKRLKSYINSVNNQENSSAAFVLFKGDVDWAIEHLQAKKFSDIPKIARTKKDGPDKPKERIVYRTHFRNGSNAQEATPETLQLGDKIVYLISKENAYWKNYETKTLNRREIDQVINGFVLDGYSVYSFSEKHRSHFENRGKEFNVALKELATATPSAPIKKMIVESSIKEDRAVKKLLQVIPSREFLDAKALRSIKQKPLKEALELALALKDDHDSHWDFKVYLRSYKNAKKAVIKDWNQKKKILQKFAEKMGILRFVDFDNYYSAKDKKELQGLILKLLK